VRDGSGGHRISADVVADYDRPRPSAQQRVFGDILAHYFCADDIDDDHDHNFCADHSETGAHWPSRRGG
jgi:hypothetical protein